MSFRLPGNFPAALLLILLLGFVLRVWGLDFGLPHLYHADEPVVVNHSLAYSTGDFNPHFFRIPPLVSYLLFGVYGLSYVVGKLAGVFQIPQDFEALFYSDPSFFYSTGRFVFGVVPGTLSIAALWFSLKRFFGERTALLSALLFSVSFLHVRDSHYIYADILLIFVMILAFIPLLSLIEKNTIKTHLAAGAVIGLAAAVKYNGVFLAVPFLLASVMGRGAVRTWRDQFFLWCAAGVLCCSVFILLNPFALLDWRFFLQEIAGESRARAEGTGFFHHLTYSLTGALGLPYLLLAFSGMLTGCRFPGDFLSKVRLVFAGFIFFYYAVLVRAGQPYDRYVLPLLPFMAFFAADAIVRISGRFYRSSIVFAVLIASAAAFPLSKSVLVNRLFAAQDIRTEAKEWIESNIPAGSKIALDTKFYMPPLSFSAAALERKRGSHRREEFSEAQKRRLEALILKDKNEKRGYDLHFLHDEPFPEKSFMLWGPFLPFQLEAIQEAGVEYLILAAPGNMKVETSPNIRLVRVFSPYRDSGRTKSFDSEALTGAPFLWSELWTRSRNGQPFKLYELR